MNTSLDEAFLSPPEFVGPPDEERSLGTRKFQGIPSLVVSPGGRLWATWYAGKTPGEDENNYVVLATSGDRGDTWRECLVVDPDGPGEIRAFDPELWVDPNGTLWFFWAQSTGHNGTVAGVWSMTNEAPDKEDWPWSSPRRLTDGIMMCKPLVLSSGEWMLPASTWRETDNSARVVVSTDEGETWEFRGASNVPKEDRRFDEHMVVERMDGSLWMLVRTNYGIGESISTDSGRTWSALAHSAIPHPSARFFIRRLASGRLLLVKHGPIAEQTGREKLMALLSDDDGQSWSSGLLLDAREKISYPDGQQSADGTIYIVYDRDRRGAREILMAVFTEDDVLAGELKSEAASRRIVVSKHPGDG